MKLPWVPVPAKRRPKHTYKRIVYTGAATPRDENPSQISVTVQVLGGDTTQISVSRNASIDEIKKMVPEGRVCCLIFKGKVLQGSSTLQKECIQDGDFLTAALGNVQKLQAIKKTAAWASDFLRTASMRWHSFDLGGADRRRQ